MAPVTQTSSIRKCVRILSLALAVAFTGTGTAAPLHAWQAGERGAAIDAWRVQAEQGDAQAALYLGYVYRRGLGVARDDARSAAWYRRAAERGLPEAQYQLALMYELGIGVVQDPDEAARWYALSSAQACPSELSAGGALGD